MTGSGFQSKKEYLFAKIDMQIKLVAGNSAGTVTAYYVCVNVTLPSLSYSEWHKYIAISNMFLLLWPHSSYRLKAPNMTR